MPKIVTVKQMQAIEKAADAAGNSYDDMMRLAGQAVAHHVLSQIIELDLYPANVLILVGPGNNGGDGLVVGADILDLMPDQEVVAYLLKDRGKKDWPLKEAQEAGVTIVNAKDDAKNDYAQLRGHLQNCHVLVDALFGTGMRLPIEGSAAELLSVVHEELAALAADDPNPIVSHVTLPDRPQVEPPVIVAVDVPSGLDCDTGEVDPLTLPADSTVTFAAAKVGQLRFPGAEYVGDLLIGKIGIEEDFEPLAKIDLQLADGWGVSRVLPQRPRNSYKGSYGKVIVVGGSTNYVGAPYLAGRAAYHVGAGWVTLAAPQIIIGTLASMLPEATWLLLAHEMGVLHENAVEILRKEIDQYSVMVLGPGMGQEEATQRFLEKLFAIEKPEQVKRHTIGFTKPAESEHEPESDDEHNSLPPLVIDADGLNLLAKLDEWWKLLPNNTVLTPHPGEFARLAGIEDTKDASAVAQVQANRVELATEHANKWDVVVVLKGAFTVVANPAGGVTVLPFATSALATAGTGDVLSGTIAGLRAQGLEPYDAAVAGAWLHGSAAMLAATAYENPASVLAGDVADMLPVALSSADKLRHGGKRFRAAEG